MEIFKSYIILNSDLKMSIGKCLAQVAHGAIYLERFLSKNFGNKFHIRDRWIESNEIIIVLVANTNVINKLKEEYKDHLKIIEAGLTEVEFGTETGIVLLPIVENDKTKLLKRCRTLNIK